MHSVLKTETRQYIPHRFSMKFNTQENVGHGVTLSKTTLKISWHGVV